MKKQPIKAIIFITVVVACVLDAVMILHYILNDSYGWVFYYYILFGIKFVYKLSKL